MVEAFSEGAVSVGHYVDAVDVCHKKINGCLACEYCHTKEIRICIQKDDMQAIYELLKNADIFLGLESKGIFTAYTESL